MTQSNNFEQYENIQQQVQRTAPETSALTSNPSFNNDYFRMTEFKNAGKSMHGMGFASGDDLLKPLNRPSGDSSQKGLELVSARALEIFDENKYGDKYLSNDKGKITEYHYNDKATKNPSFKDITYDKDGKATSFKGPDGLKYEKLPADQKSPFEAVRNGNGWMSEESRSPIDLGNVSFDKNGYHQTGKGSLPFKLPERK